MNSSTVSGVHVAALFVDRKGPYWGRADVDAYDKARDAMTYCGPWPVVAHPPCGRWCMLAHAVQGRHGHKVGDDGGTFAFALDAVRRWGGVLEHPAFTMAWAAHGLFKPVALGWQQTIDGEWVGECFQVAYGHEAYKRTWLFYVGRPPAPLRLSKPKATAVIGHDTKWERSQKARGVSPLKRLDKSVTHLSPPEFAEALIELAKGAA